VAVNARWHVQFREHYLTLLPRWVKFLCVFYSLAKDAALRLSDKNVIGYFFVFLTLLSFVIFAKIAHKIIGHTSFHLVYPWFNAIGVTLSFYLDGLSALFSLLITGIGALVMYYSISYMHEHEYFARFFIYLFAFMLSMLGLVIAGNLITLFVFWELTAITSYLLIGFDHERINARNAALKAFLVTAAGGLVLLLAFVVIGYAASTYEIADLLNNTQVLRSSHWYSLITVLIIIGAFTKSAQFPFHFWLPAAMEAPTPVSAYLHSATMVQAGIYLLARFHPLLSGTPLWFNTLTVFGSITMVGGVILALRETDIKLMLAYTTVSALGSLTYMLASDQQVVIKACVSFILAHGLYKAALFLAAGNIYKATGGRDINQLHGLIKVMPLTFASVVIAASSMGGLPPLLGFYVKELVYEAKLSAPFFAQMLTGMVVLTNMILVMLALLMVIKPFLSKAKKIKYKKLEKSYAISGVTLAVSIIGFGLFPFLIDQNILSPAVSAVMHYPVAVEIELWHGFTPSLALSAITILGGYLLYLKRTSVLRFINYFKFYIYHGPQMGYETLIHWTVQGADWQSRMLQNGSLPIYITVTLLTVCVVMSISLLAIRPILAFSGMPFTWLTLFLSGWLLLTAWAAARTKELINAIIFLGAFGLGVSLFFLVYAAPDVAMTQLLVETLFVIVFALTFYKIPSLPDVEVHKMGRWYAPLRISIATLTGILVTVLLLAVMNGTMNDSVSQYFIRNSVILGHGRNIVNVILVDFRAFDTAGEVIILIIAALGVYGLIKKKQQAGWL